MSSTHPRPFRKAWRLALALSAGLLASAASHASTARPVIFVGYNC